MEHPDVLAAREFVEGPAAWAASPDTEKAIEHIRRLMPLTAPPRAAEIASRQLGKVLVAAGIVPPHCAHAIIELKAGDIVNVYTRCYGDERLLEVDWSPLAMGVKEEECKPANSDTD
jgi:hypothetical protein